MVVKANIQKTVADISCIWLDRLGPGSPGRSLCPGWGGGWRLGSVRSPEGHSWVLGIGGDWLQEEEQQKEQQEEDQQE